MNDSYLVLAVLLIFGGPVGPSGDKTPEDYFNRGVEAGKQGNLKQAVADFSKAIELNRRYEDAWFNRGRAYNRLGEHGKALADLDEALRLGYRRAPVYFERGTAHNGKGAYAKAIAELTKLMSDNYFLGQRQLQT